MARCKDCEHLEPSEIMSTYSKKTKKTINDFACPIYYKNMLTRNISGIDIWRINIEQDNDCAIFVHKRHGDTIVNHDILSNINQAIDDIKHELRTANMLKAVELRLNPSTSLSPYTKQLLNDIIAGKRTH